MRNNTFILIILQIVKKKEKQIQHKENIIKEYFI